MVASLHFDDLVSDAATLEMHLSVGESLILVPRFDAEGPLTLIERHRVGVGYLVLVMYATRRV
jgi:hypothetical protein